MEFTKQCKGLTGISPNYKITNISIRLTLRGVYDVPIHTSTSTIKVIQ